MVSANGVHVHRENIQAILDWPLPKIILHLHGFFGIYSYYMRFVKGFSQLATPLTDLTKKGAFRWTDEAQRTFD
jgi:hypothetical protein